MLITMTDYANKFRCIRNKTTKQYELFVTNNNKLTRVNIAPANKPFEIVASYDNQLAAIRMDDQLILVNPMTGKIPTDIFISPLAIIYDAKNLTFDAPNNIVNGKSGQYLTQAINAILFQALNPKVTTTMPILQGTPIQQVTGTKRIKKTTTTKKPARTRKQSALSAEITAPYSIQKKHNVKYRAQSATKHTKRVVAPKSQDLAIAISKAERTFRRK